MLAKDQTESENAVTACLPFNRLADIENAGTALCWGERG